MMFYVPNKRFQRAEHLLLFRSEIIERRIEIQVKFDVKSLGAFFSATKKTILEKKPKKPKRRKKKWVEIRLSLVFLSDGYGAFVDGRRRGH